MLDFLKTAAKLNPIRHIVIHPPEYTLDLLI